MQLHLVTKDGNTQVIPSTFSVSLSLSSGDYKKALEEAKRRLARVGFMPSTTQIYLLQAMNADNRTYRYWLFVPTAPRVELTAIDTDRSYVSDGSVRFWAKGDEDRKRRFFVLNTEPFFDSIIQTGIGEAMGERVHSQSLVSLIKDCW